MEALGIDLKYFIFQVVNFLLLFIILTKLLHKPIMNLLDKRNEEIAQSLKNAEKIKQEMVKSEEKQQEMLVTAKKEALEIITEAKSEAASLANNITQGAQEKAEYILAKTEESITQQKEQMKEELKEEITDLALKISEKIIKEEVSVKDKQAKLSQITKEME